MLLFLSCSTAKFNENSATANLLQAKQFVFIAQTAIPARTAAVTISGGGYDLKVMQDSISMLLPFYGRVTDVSAGRTGGPIELKTKKFSYSLNKKSSRWEIMIVPSDGQSNIRSMSLSVSDNGYASLNVVSNNRDNMSYNGIVEPLK